MLRHTFVTTMLAAGVDLRGVQIAARHADPRTTMRYDPPARTSTATPTTSSPPTWRPTISTSVTPRQFAWHREDGAVDVARLHLTRAPLSGAGWTTPPFVEAITRAMQGRARSRPAR